MNNPEDLLKEYQGLKGDQEREQYVTQEPMSLDEVDRLSNMMNEYKGIKVTPEQKTALQETELAADIASMEPNPEPIIDAQEEQKRIDMMSFKEAFDEHYNQYKDLPVEERPTYIYRGSPVKVETKEEKLGITKPDTDLSKTLIEKPKEEVKKQVKSFKFVPQTKSVNLDVNKTLKKKLEQAAKSIGESDLVISSGVRGDEATKQILEDKKKKFKLDNFGDSQDLIDTMILQGSSPDKLEYKDRGYLNKVIKERFPDQANDLIEKFRKLRLEFAGYKSPHLKGEKVDVPYSHFVDKYGKEEGFKKVEQFKQALKEQGIYIHDEPNVGRHGVLDLKLK